MSAQLRNLAWKEWHERKWAFALGTLWILGGVVYAVAYHGALGFRAPVASFYSTCSLYALFAAVFLAMRTAVGERTQRTLGFSSALPVSLRSLGWVRLGGGIVTLAGPIVLGALLLSIVLVTGLAEQAAERPARGAPHVALVERASLSGPAAVGFLWKVTAIVVAAGIGLFFILAVIGARCRTEAQVGFIGAVVAFPWLVTPGLRETAWGHWLGAVVPQSLAINYGYADERGGYGDLNVAPLVWVPLALNLLVLVVLGIWFTGRYGTRPQLAVEQIPSTRRWRAPALCSRLPIRWPGRAAALVWLDLRQALPMAMTGLALACLMTATTVLFQIGTGEFHNAFPSADAGRLPAMIAGQLPGSTWIVGALWAAVVGSGVFAAELQPRLGSFWRSRPISPSGWFWTKFFVGLIAVLGVLDGVTILMSWNSPYAYSPNKMSLAYVACMPLVHATLYALAVLGVCGLRRPVLGAAVAVLAYSLVATGLESFPAARFSEPLTVYNQLFQAEQQGVFDLTDHAYPLVYGTLALLTIAAAVLAWRATLRPGLARGPE